MALNSTLTHCNIRKILSVWNFESLENLNLNSKLLLYFKYIYDTEYIILY